MCPICEEIQFALAGTTSLLTDYLHVDHLCLTSGLLKVMFCLQVTGGGGYTKENVARCWTLETGVLLDTELPNGMLRQFYCYPL